ncbi:MAG TPA: hypothetical protein VLE73_05220 [Candidatus Saccharimonadales bacterium]|nr:hypothetical protein [Candidatus Saccharimonadales bacterium]
MNPEQVPPPTFGGGASPPSSGGNYDFIMNPGKPGKVPRSSRFSSGPLSNPMVVRIILVIGGLVVLLAAASAVQKILFGDKTNTGELIGLTQTETEVARLADMGDKSSDQTMRNTMVTANLVVLTQRQEITKFMAKHGGINPKLYVGKRSKTTDTRLTRAKQTSTFDSTYQDIMTSELTDYAKEIKTAHGHALGKTEKDLLNKHYEQTQMIIKQLPVQPTDTSDG